MMAETFQNNDTKPQESQKTPSRINTPQMMRHIIYKENEN